MTIGKLASMVKTLPVKAIYAVVRSGVKWGELSPIQCRLRVSRSLSGWWCPSWPQNNNLLTHIRCLPAMNR